MKEKRTSQNAKYGEATKVIRLPESLANFLQQHQSVVAELVSQINKGELNLSVDVTALQPVTDNQAYDFDKMIATAIENQLADIKDRIMEQHGAGVRGISMGYEALLDDVRKEVSAINDRLEALENTRSEATAPAKKPLMQLVEEEEEEIAA